MSVEAILRILYPGVQGLLNQKQAYNLVLKLIILALDPIDVDSLRFLSRFLTPVDYDELVQERTLMAKCSYPTCTHELKTHRGTKRTPSTWTAFPWSKSYCSLHCSRASQFYAKQLSSEVLVTRRDVAWNPFGTMKYENDILILEQVETYARTHNIEIIDAISALMMSSDSLTKSLQKMTIDEQNERPGINGVEIRERRPGPPAEAPNEQQPAA